MKLIFNYYRPAENWTSVSGPLWADDNTRKLHEEWLNTHESTGMCHIDAGPSFLYRFEHERDATAFLLRWT